MTYTAEQVAEALMLADAVNIGGQSLEAAIVKAGYGFMVGEDKAVLASGEVLRGVSNRIGELLEKVSK